jgi:uncharacterized protein (DUF433 family)
MMMGKAVIRGTRIPVELLLRQQSECASEGQSSHRVSLLTCDDIHAFRYANTLAREEVLFLDGTWEVTDVNSSIFAIFTDSYRHQRLDDPHRHSDERGGLHRGQSSRRGPRDTIPTRYRSSVGAASVRQLPSVL